jgi:hypothetical protein
MTEAIESLAAIVGARLAQETAPVIFSGHADVIRVLD